MIPNLAPLLRRLSPLTPSAFINAVNFLIPCRGHPSYPNNCHSTTLFKIRRPLKPLYPNSWIRSLNVEVCWVTIKMDSATITQRGSASSLDNHGKSRCSSPIRKGLLSKSSWFGSIRLSCWEPRFFGKRTISVRVDGIVSQLFTGECWCSLRFFICVYRFSFF